VTVRSVARVDLADPEARELIERAAVADIDADPSIEGRNLIAAAVRRELARRVNETDPNEILANRDARLAPRTFRRAVHRERRGRAVARVAATA
jgi:hypothetical protein